MNRLRILAACGLILLAGGAVAQQMRIGYVNGQRLQQDSKLAQRAAEALKQEFSARERELAEMRDRVAGLQSQLKEMGPNVSTRDQESKQREFAALAQRFQQTQRAFEEDVARRRAEERQKFLKTLGAVVDKIAKTRKLDLVLFRAVYAAPGIDITNEVMKALDGS